MVRATKDVAPGSSPYRFEPRQPQHIRRGERLTKYARRVLWNSICKLDPTIKPLVPNLMLLHMFLDTLLQALRILPLRFRVQYDESKRYFPTKFIFDTDNSAVVDVGMFEEMSFEFGWGYLVSADFENFLRNAGGE
jgi:hypothetical protein